MLLLETWSGEGSDESRWMLLMLLVASATTGVATCYARYLIAFTTHWVTGREKWGFIEEGGDTADHLRAIRAVFLTDWMTERPYDVNDHPLNSRPI